DTKWKDPYAEQWSLSVDHDFGQGWGTRISYIGMNARQLVWAPNENDLPYSSTVSAFNQPLTARPFPNFGTVNDRATGANGSYHSLQLNALHRYAYCLIIYSNHTIAKSLADHH